MSILKREKIFETNSSSTHSLVIPKKVDEEKYDLNESLDYDYCYGREESRLVDDWDEKLAYLYVTIKALADNKWERNQYKITKNMIKEFKERINKIYNEVYEIVEYKPHDGDIKPKDIFDYVDGKKEPNRNCFIFGKCYGEPYVDHVGQFADKEDFLNKVFQDDEFLKRFIFNKESYITIGGDEYRGYNIKTIGFEYDYKEGDHRMNEKGELPPKEWLDECGCIKDEYWDRYWNEYTLETGEFWDKLREYEKENDVYLKGN